ncbi:MAG: zinc finger domain-containing protein [archaeon]
MECISCAKETAEVVKFPCPNCSEAILRCGKCKDLSITYECKCGFKGP